ncbi:YrdB family protein [Demequina sp. TTPB684]|uniref:YrdB family protein n=1 Tax=unclassified Demequina TaxID=2620311 RepID=UPI001CF4D17A|nr:MULTISPECIES: YrdB family protein [unclassified Demequina]MCB2413466.1 YrdB family protein [Demequina sp. TTPB684]UPU88769.1 YrdB family protein [Demequina sp. TMPB413]
MRSFGAALVFFAEMGMLIGFVVLGLWSGDGPMSVVLAIALPAAVAVVWGVFLAPRAPRVLPSRIGLVFRLALILAGAVAAWIAGVAWLAVVTVVLAVVGMVMARGAEREIPGARAPR